MLQRETKNAQDLCYTCSGIIRGNTFHDVFPSESTEGGRERESLTQLGDRSLVAGLHVAANLQKLQ